MPANGGTDPYPIPWLGKNGNHNQPAGPNLEPSHMDQQWRWLWKYDTIFQSVGFSVASSENYIFWP